MTPWFAHCPDSLSSVLDVLWQVEAVTDKGHTLNKHFFARDGASFPVMKRLFVFLLHKSIAMTGWGGR